MINIIEKWDETKDSYKFIEMDDKSIRIFRNRIPNSKFSSKSIKYIGQKRGGERRVYFIEFKVDNNVISSFTIHKMDDDYYAISAKTYDNRVVTRSAMYKLDTDEDVIDFCTEYISMCVNEIDKINKNIEVLDNRIKEYKNERNLLLKNFGFPY